jgi:galactokinase
MNPEDRATALYRGTFGSAPAAIASAPGRVNLIGEHVDYHGGHVLPIATRERTAVAVGPLASGMRAVSEQEQPVEVPDFRTPTGRWSDYVAGVAALGGFGVPDAGLAVAVASDVPFGSGLSSSAAIEVATALALTRWAGRTAAPRALAELAWRAETEFVGMPCGRMDQMASALAPAGSALLIDCRSLETSAVPVGVDLLLADSGEKHTLRTSAYAERRREGAEAFERLQPTFPALVSLVDIPLARLAEIARQLPPPLDLRVRHVVNENQRTLLAARALEQGDWAAFGAHVNASHDSLRDLYACSTPRLDAIVAAARAVPDVLGARLVGAGWGGSVLIVCRPGAGDAVAAQLAGDAALALPSVRRVVPGVGAAA